MAAFDVQSSSFVEIKRGRKLREWRSEVLDGILASIIESSSRGSSKAFLARDPASLDTNRGLSANLHCTVYRTGYWVSEL